MLNIFGSESFFSSVFHIHITTMKKTNFLKYLSIFFRCLLPGLLSFLTSSNKWLYPLPWVYSRSNTVFTYKYLNEWEQSVFKQLPLSTSMNKFHPFSLDMNQQNITYLPCYLPRCAGADMRFRGRCIVHRYQQLYYAHYIPMSFHS